MSAIGWLLSKVLDDLVVLDLALGTVLPVQEVTSVIGGRGSLSIAMYLDVESLGCNSVAKSWMTGG